MPTLLEDLTACEKDRLDLELWYPFISRIPEKQIKLFFQRLREQVSKRIISGQDDVIKQIGQQLAGISFVESKFLQIKNEQKGLDKRPKV